MKGGYKIIDLKNTALADGVAATIPGIYEQIEGNYRKPLLLEGIQLDGVEYPAAYIEPVVSSDDYVFNLYGYTFEITDDDAVTATVIE